MMRAFISPSRYYQGPGLLDRLGEFAAGYGKSAFVLITANGMARFGERLKSSFAASSVSCCMETFGGESSQKEIDRNVAKAKEAGAQVVIGVGGGKILDTAKSAAHSL